MTMVMMLPDLNVTGETDNYYYSTGDRDKEEEMGVVIVCVN